MIRGVWFVRPFSGGYELYGVELFGKLWITRPRWLMRLLGRFLKPPRIVPKCNLN